MRKCHDLKWEAPFFGRLFTCAICKNDVVDYANRNGRDRHVAPVCRPCEKRYSDNVPQTGAFMDRRIFAQLSALTNILTGEAHCKQWEQRHGRA